MPNSETSEPIIPESKSNLTVRPPAEDSANPSDSRRLDLPESPEAGRTLKLPLGKAGAGADSTQRLVVPRPDEAPIRVQKVDQPAEAAGQTLKVTFRSANEPRRWQLPVILGSLVVLGGAAYLAFFRAKSLPAPPPPRAIGAPQIESIPQAGRATFEQAKAGDVRAMHMLGLMYYNGLNLPRDREKGLYWLRKAAESGSAGARVELSQIEGGR